MSAPDTNIEKQEERHKPALLGIKSAMIFGILMVLIVIFLSVMRSGDPAPAEGSETSMLGNMGLNDMRSLRG